MLGFGALGELAIGELPAGGGVSGTIANTLSAFTSSITGSPVNVGTVAVTLSAFTPSMSGTTTVSGTMAAVLNAFTATIQGTTTIVGTMATTLEEFVSSFFGNVGDEIASTFRTLFGVGR